MKSFELIMKRANALWYYLFKYPFYFFMFKKIGKKTRIFAPLKIEGYSNINLGNNVIIGYQAWLAALPLTGSTVEILVEDGANIGNFNHIYATSRIIIEKDALIADKVYISDNLHSYESIHIPIKSQPIKQKREVVIGSGCWIGENVCILGASVGTNSIVGSNSVVTKDIPDYSVAVGSPARVIKRYCHRTNSWIKTDSTGKFIE